MQKKNKWNRFEHKTFNQIKIDRKCKTLLCIQQQHSIVALYICRHSSELVAWWLYNIILFQSKLGGVAIYIFTYRVGTCMPLGYSIQQEWEIYKGEKI